MVCPYVNRKQVTARIIELWNSGLDIQQIAARCGKTPAQVNCAITHAKIRTPRGHRVNLPIEQGEGVSHKTPPRFIEHE